MPVNFPWQTEFLYRCEVCGTLNQKYRVLIQDGMHQVCEVCYERDNLTFNYPPRILKFVK